MSSPTTHAIDPQLAATLRALDADWHPDDADAAEEWTLSLADLVRVFEAGRRAAVGEPPSDGNLRHRMHRLAIDAAEYIAEDAAALEATHTRGDGDWSDEESAQVEYDLAVRLARDLQSLADRFAPAAPDVAA